MVAGLRSFGACLCPPPHVDWKLLVKARSIARLCVLAALWLTVLAIPAAGHAADDPLVCSDRTGNVRPGGVIYLYLLCSHDDSPTSGLTFSVVDIADPDVVEIPRFDPTSMTLQVEGGTPGTSSITLHASDEADPVGTDFTIDITVNPTHNTAPICSGGGQTRNVRVGASAAITVFCFDDEFDVVAYSGESAMRGTTQGIHVDGDWRRAAVAYTAPATAGPETVTLYATDQLSAPVMTTLSFNVIGADVETAPTCYPPQTTVTSGEAPTPIYVQCEDAEGDTITYSIASQASKGSASVSGGLVRYGANIGATGTDTFTLIASDGTLQTAPITATITILPPTTTTLSCTDLAVTMRLGATTNIGPSCTLDFTHAISWTIVSNSHPAIAAADSLPQGGVSAHALAEGTTTIRIRLQDLTAGTQAEANVILTVDANVNGAPSCMAEPMGGPSQLIARPGATASRRYFCTDPDDDDFDVTATTTVPGQVQITRSEPCCVVAYDIGFTPALGTPAQTGSLVITIEDERGAHTTQSLAIVVADAASNRAPTCTGLYAFTVATKTGPQNLGFGPNSCSDADGDAIRFDVISHPVHTSTTGPASFAAPAGSSYAMYPYTPSHAYVGSDSFQVRACDADSCSPTYTIAITVQPGGLACSPPTAPTTLRTGAAPFAVYPECTNNFEYTSEVDAAHPYDPSIVSVSVGEGGSVRITPLAPGSTTVRVLMSDAFSPEPIPLAFPVTVANNANHVPECMLDTVQSPTPIRANQSRAIGVYCRDLDGDSLSATTTQAPLRGSIADVDIAPDPDEAYTVRARVWYAAGSDLGSDTFEVTFSDSHGGTSVFTGEVTVVAASANSRPSCDAIATSAFADAGAQELWPYCTDEDGDVLTVQVVQLPAHGTVTSTPGVRPSILYTPDAGYRGSDSFTFRVSDGQLTSNAATSMSVSVIDPVLETAIEAGPSGTTSSATATFQFASIGGQLYECSLDGAAWASCPATHTLSGVTAGAHTLRVRALGANNAVDLSPAWRSWIVNAASLVLTSATVASGGSISSPNASSAHPMSVVITSPVAGTVVVTSSASPTNAAPAAYQLLGAELQISAPSGTTNAPLRLTFELAAASIPAGTSRAAITVIRNGVPVTATCAGETAVPSTCVRERVDLPNGGVRIVVLTTQASSWTFGATTSSGTAPPTPLTPKPTAPTPTVPVRTKFAGLSAKTVKRVCTKAQAKNGVRIKGRVWCFDLVMNVKLVTATGKPVAKHRIRFDRVVKRRASVLRAVNTSASGTASMKLPLSIPKSSRASVSKALAWIASQYGTVRATHLTSDTTYVTAPIASTKTTSPRR